METFNICHPPRNRAKAQRRVVSTRHAPGWRIVFTTAILAFVSCSSAVNYYVDFAGGTDSADGASPVTPWKHCPGDPNSAGRVRSVKLGGGDVVNFRGGVTYNGSVVSTWQGNSDHPLLFQSASGWGVGRAVLNGTFAGLTNIHGFDVRGHHTTISGFDIQNYRGHGAVIAGVYGNASGFVLTNNVIHHIGTFPYHVDDRNQDWLAGGQAVNVSACANLLIVSNLIYDCNYNAVGGQNPTNLILWGNELHDVQNHGFQVWAWGYHLIANNYIHDFTNAYRHSDAMQILACPLSSHLIICGNYCRDVVDAVNIEYFIGPAGKTYVFNNRSVNTAYGTNGLSGWANGNSISTRASVDAVYFFNNTMVDHNAGWGGLKTPFSLYPTNVWTNYFCLNNIYYDSTGGILPSNRVTRIVNLTTGFNCFTNYWRGEATVSGDPKAGNNLVPLKRYQAHTADLEEKSIYGPILFADYAAQDLRPRAGSAVIGAGTNLASLIGTFDFIPQPWRPDPTKDAAGVPRGPTWDIGAYQHVQDSAQDGRGPARVTGETNHR